MLLSVNDNNDNNNNNKDLKHENTKNKNKTKTKTETNSFKMQNTNPFMSSFDDALYQTNYYNMSIFLMI
jgi:hypothetical protein